MTDGIKRLKKQI